MAANLAIYESTAKHTWSLLLSSLALLQYRTYDLSAHRSDLAALRHFEGSVAPYPRRVRATAIDSATAQRAPLDSSLHHMSAAER